MISGDHCIASEEGTRLEAEIKLQNNRWSFEKEFREGGNRVLYRAELWDDSHFHEGGGLFVYAQLTKYLLKRRILLFSRRPVERWKKAWKIRVWGLANDSDGRAAYPDNFFEVGYAPVYVLGKYAHDRTYETYGFKLLRATKRKKKNITRKLLLELFGPIELEIQGQQSQGYRKCLVVS